jgi:hypothetical protein
MTTYTLTNSNYVVREDERGVWSIPDDPANTDWQAYQAWLAAGNTPSPYIPPPPAIPQQVPMWAVRTVLQNDGLFDQAQALIEASTDNALKNVWEYGNFADRNSNAIASLAAALDLTSEQVDQMFIDANDLSV